MLPYLLDAKCFQMCDEALLLNLAASMTMHL